MNNDNTYNSISTTPSPFGTREFLESNSLIAKIAFLLLVVFFFVILLRIGVSIMAYFFKPNESPRLIDGMVDASQMLVFPQDPNSVGAVTVSPMARLAAR